jgi:hypothetical protein
VSETGEAPAVVEAVAGPVPEPVGETLAVADPTGAVAAVVHGHVEAATSANEHAAGEVTGLVDGIVPADVIPAEAMGDPIAAGLIDGADQRFLVTAGFIALASIAFSPLGPAEACSGSARLLFTNVRLLPCMAEETARRYAATAAEMLGRSSSTSRGGASAVPKAALAAGEPAQGVFRAFRDGFARGTSRVGQEVDGQAGDARLIAQLGMALGFVYLAFLTVWFWATRLRWQARA